jgi:hypothetical protein
MDQTSSHLGTGPVRTGSSQLRTGRTGELVELVELVNW